MLGEETIDYSLAGWFCFVLFCFALLWKIWKIWKKKFSPIAIVISNFLKHQMFPLFYITINKIKKKSPENEGQKQRNSYRYLVLNTIRTTKSYDKQKITKEKKKSLSHGGTPWIKNCSTTTCGNVQDKFL